MVGCRWRWSSIAVSSDNDGNNDVVSDGTVISPTLLEIATAETAI